MELDKRFELGVYTFGNIPSDENGRYGSSAEAIPNIPEALKLAGEVGLNYFDFCKHHTRSMPVSSPTYLENAAAASTGKIKLGTSVSVLSTDEPIRIFLQLATAASISPGRIDMVTGRGSSDITCSIFDFSESE